MKNKHAQQLGKLGGKARAKNHSKKQLSEWGKTGGRPKNTIEEFEPTKRQITLMKSRKKLVSFIPNRLYGKKEANGVARKNVQALGFDDEIYEAYGEAVDKRDWRRALFLYQEHVCLPSTPFFSVGKQKCSADFQ